MNQYHAVVSVDAPDGVHRRVSLLAQSLEEAEKLLAAQYGRDKIFSLWGEKESARPRDE